jgi:uncharacterized protein
METLLVALVAYGAYLLIGGLSLKVIFIMQGVAGSPAELDALAQQGRWQGIPGTIGSLAAIAVLWIAIRKAGREFSEYLALNWPSWDEVVLALLITAIVVAAWMVMWGPRGPMEGGASDPTLMVRSTGALFMLLVSGCILAPAMEEFLFRGFLFRGWSQSYIGPVGSILIISAIWAIAHTHYDWWACGSIFVTGLVLGYFRWRSNSTWLTFIVHSALNILAFFTMGKYI